MRNIPGKTLLLIGVLITATVVLLGFALYMVTKQKSQPATTIVAVSPTPPVPKTAVVSFSPTLLSFPQGSSSSAVIDITTNTGESSITGAQIEVDFDPQVITNVKYVPADAQNSLLGLPGAYITLFIDTKTPGKIVFANALSASATPVNGTGSVGKISFTVIKGVKPSTILTLGPETKVTTTTTQESILKSTTPLTVNLQ